VSEPRLLLPHTRKRKPYKRPSKTQVDRQEAKWLLETYADATDKSTKTLLRQVLISPARTEKEQGGERARDVRVQKPTMFRRMAFCTSICFMIAVPLTLLIGSVSAGSTLQIAVAKIFLIWFPVWAIFTVWVTLDAPSLYGFAGPRPDPFGVKAHSLSALGIANIVSMIAFLLVMTR